MKLFIATEALRIEIKHTQVLLVQVLPGGDSCMTQGTEVLGRLEVP